jgi:hypothetical protein
MNFTPHGKAAPAATSNVWASQLEAAVPAEQTQIYGGTE